MACEWLSASLLRDGNEKGKGSITQSGEGKLKYMLRVSKEGASRERVLETALRISVLKILARLLLVEWIVD